MSILELYDGKLEFTAISTLTCADTILAGKMLASLSDDCFFLESTRGAFKRIRSMAASKGKLPTTEEILADTVLKQKYRRELEANLPKALKNKQRIDAVTTGLKQFWKLRQIYERTEANLSALQQEGVDIDALISENTQHLASLNVSDNNIEQNLIHLGAMNNSVSLVTEILYGEKIEVVPTGFSAWDIPNGGVPYGALMVMAGTTGGGKSALGSIQLLLNMSKFANTCLVPLEMTAKETYDRILANLGEVKVNKFAHKKLSDDEKTKCITEYKKAVLVRKEAGTRYSIYEPESDVDIDEILYGLLALGNRVILIDYISLLKGVDGDDAWQALGRVARRAKIFAKTHNIIVILLAQLSDEGKIRYAKAIVEHANIAWFWQYTEQARDSGILDIHPVKARNQDPTPFQLWHDFSIMQARDILEGEYTKALSDPEYHKNHADNKKFVADAVSDAVRGVKVFSMDDDIPI